MTTISEHPQMHGAHHFGREVVTTLLINTGVLAFINATQAYDVAMKTLQFLLLLFSVVYTGFRAAKAYTDWQESRARRRAAEATQKDIQK